MTQSFDPAFSPAILSRNARPGRTSAAGTSSHMKPKSSLNWSTMIVLNESPTPPAPVSRQSFRDASADVRKVRTVRPSMESSKAWAPLPVASPASQTKVAGRTPQFSGTASVSHSTAEVPSEARAMSAEETSE